MDIIDPSHMPLTVWDSSSRNPPNVAVRVVTAPVNGELKRSSSWFSSDAQAQEVLISGGDIGIRYILTMALDNNEITRFASGTISSQILTCVTRQRPAEMR